MKILNKFKGKLMFIMAVGLFLTLGSKDIYAVENDIESGIYELQNDVYHESETGVAMSRTYLLPTMKVKVTKGNIIYTIGFSGSDYMENYRIKVNGEEASVEILDDSSEEGIIKLNVEVDKVDADMNALIYIGPMERDVEFRIIPKMETLTLIESIEEIKEEVAPVEEENVEVVSNTAGNNSNMIGIFGLAIVIILGSVIVIKIKKK